RVEKPVETALEKANEVEKVDKTNETQTVEGQTVDDDKNAPVSPDEFDAIRQTIDEIDAGIARGVWAPPGAPGPRYRASSFSAPVGR
ncbi:MAG: hypothetical protein IJY15_07630, partial [Thermoguttaceae bacterium]|nr:hypothetical protein [Thermoguttaceae bacterium]